MGSHMSHEKHASENKSCCEPDSITRNPPRNQCEPQLTLHQCPTCRIPCAGSHKLLRLRNSSPKQELWSPLQTPSIWGSCPKHWHHHPSRNMEIFLDWFLPSPHIATFQQVQSLALWLFSDLLISTSLHLSLNTPVQATSISLLKNPDTSQLASHIHCPSTHFPS